MSVVIQQKLAELVTRFGRGICEDPQRLEALLRDYCPQASKGEVHVVAAAARERVPLDLLAAQGSTSQELLEARLRQRLQTNLAFTEDAATTAVRTWCYALGITPASHAAPAAVSPQARTVRAAPEARPLQAKAPDQPRTGGLAMASPQSAAPASDHAKRAAAPPPLPSPPATVGRVHEIAYRQKVLLYVVLLNLLIVAPIWAMAAKESSLALAVWLSIFAINLWSWYKLCVALKIWRPAIWLGGLCLLFSCLSLLAQLLLIRRATKLLKKAGVRVGLMGANLRTIPKDT